MNAVEIEQAISELAELPFDPEEFSFAFREAFGNKGTTIRRLRKGESNIAVCPIGGVTKTLTALKASPAIAKAKAKLILATDGETVEASLGLGPRS
jgi:hypothetical protein